MIDATEIPGILYELSAETDFPILTAEKFDESPIIRALGDNGNTWIEDLQLQQELLYEKRLSRASLAGHKHVRVREFSAERVEPQEGSFTCPCQEGRCAIVSSGPGEFHWDKIGGLP